MLGADEPIRVLRVIARLNVGGPSLHVSYLAEGLASRGYDTTLAAGEISEGEASMAFVAEQRGIDVRPVPGAASARSRRSRRRRPSVTSRG